MGPEAVHSVLLRRLVVWLSVSSVWTQAGAGFAKWPYLQYATDSSIVVRWETTVLQGGRVQYGFTPEYGFEVEQVGQTVDHELLLEGLAGDTTYHYRVISDADTTPDTAFRSMSGRETPFRLVVFGDPHGDSATNQQVSDRMGQVAPRPVLLSCTGDLTPDCRARSYRGFFNTQRRVMAVAPLYPALGNHDIDSLVYWYRFLVLPNNERFYSLEWGNSAFHFLNPYESFLPGSEQHSWLLGELRRDSTRPEIRHIFVFVHTPAFSTNAVYPGNADIRQHLCPLFERYGVDIVFSGHVHAYEHSLVNGVHYITTGGAGASLATQWGAVQPWTVYREASYHFVVVDVAGDTVTAAGVRVNGSGFDTLRLVRAQVGHSENSVRGYVSPVLKALSPVADVVLLKVEIPERQWLQVSILDAAGRKLAQPAACWFERGAYTLRWEASPYPYGVYWWHIRGDGIAASAPFLLLRSGFQHRYAADGDIRY